MFGNTPRATQHNVMYGVRFAPPFTLCSETDFVEPTKLDFFDIVKCLGAVICICFTLCVRERVTFFFLYAGYNLALI